MDARRRSVSDLQWNLSQLWRAWVTWSVLLVLLVVHLVKWSITDFTPYYRLFGLSRDGVLSLQLWQLLSYGFIHGSWFHLSMNGLLLLIVGSKIELMTGKASMLKVLLLGVFAGGFLHLLMSDRILIGVSGGVLALVLFFTGLSPESQLLMPFKLSAKNLGRGLIGASLILALLDPGHRLPVLSVWGRGLEQLGLDTLFRFSHATHLGGAMAGWWCARWLLRPRVTLQSLRRDRLRREGGSSSH